MDVVFLHFGSDLNAAPIPNLLHAQPGLHNAVIVQPVPPECSGYRTAMCPHNLQHYFNTYLYDF